MSSEPIRTLETRLPLHHEPSPSSLSYHSGVDLRLHEITILNPTACPNLRLHLPVRPLCGEACVLSCFSHVRLFVTAWTAALQAPFSIGLLGKNTGVGGHDLLQEIFPTQRSNPCLLCLLHWRSGSLQRAPPGKPCGKAVRLFPANLQPIVTCSILICLLRLIQTHLLAGALLVSSRKHYLLHLTTTQHPVFNLQLPLSYF